MKVPNNVTALLLALALFALVIDGSHAFSLSRRGFLKHAVVSCGALARQSAPTLHAALEEELKGDALRGMLEAIDCPEITGERSSSRSERGNQGIS
jgi:hypothetical protein